MNRPATAGRTWSASFGSLLLCGPGTSTITKIAARYKVGEPVDIEFVLRKVPAADERTGPPVSWAPLGTATETPEQLTAGKEMRSSSVRPASGAEVVGVCDEDPAAPFTEVITVVTVDAGGVWIDGLDIEYTAGSEEFDLPVHWSFVACGNLIDDPRAC